MLVSSGGFGVVVKAGCRHGDQPATEELRALFSTSVLYTLEEKFSSGLLYTLFTIKCSVVVKKKMDTALKQIQVILFVLADTNLN